jgi:Protein of unknown function (DUF3102)
VAARKAARPATDRPVRRPRRGDRLGQQIGAEANPQQPELQAQLSLEELAARIKAEYEATRTNIRHALASALRAGELLIAAKARLRHGEWLPWLRDHCDMSERSAQAFMRVGRNREEIESNPQTTADLTLDAALQLLAKPKPTAARADEGSTNEPSDRAADLAAAAVRIRALMVGVPVAEEPHAVQVEISEPAAEAEPPAAKRPLPDAVRKQLVAIVNGSVNWTTAQNLSEDERLLLLEALTKVRERVAHAIEVLQSMVDSDGITP